MTRVLLISLAVFVTGWAVAAAVPFVLCLHHWWQWRQERPRAQGRTVGRQARLP